MWAGCRLHTTATSICSLCYRLSSSAWARLLCTRHAYENFALPPTPSPQLHLHSINSPITLYLLGAHGPLACRGNSYRTYSPVLSMSCQLPWNGLGRYWTLVWETPAWFPALRSCKSTRESYHHSAPSVSLSVTSLSEIRLHLSWLGQNRMKPGMWMLCKLWSAMRHRALLPLWYQLWSTQEPLGSRGCCLPSQHPCQAPSLLTESQLCSAAGWLSVWYPGMIMTDLKESWKPCHFFAGLRQSMWAESHSMTPEVKHCGNGSQSLTGYSSLT